MIHLKETTQHSNSLFSKELKKRVKAEFKLFKKNTEIFDMDRENFATEVFQSLLHSPLKCGKLKFNYKKANVVW